MSAKSLLAVVLLGAIVPADAKIREVPSEVSVANSHERVVREPLVQSCYEPTVQGSSDHLVGASSCQAKCLFKDD